MPLDSARHQNIFNIGDIKIIRVTAVPGYLDTFSNGLLQELQSEGYDVVAVSSLGPETIRRQDFHVFCRMSLTTIPI